jgi:hypothetical protein
MLLLSAQEAQEDRLLPTGETLLLQNPTVQFLVLMAEAKEVTQIL